MAETGPSYDRALLLAGARRNAILDRWEVQRYGADSYRDPDYVSIYGLRPAEWYAKGIRLLGRTAVECTRDDLGDAIGRDVAGIALMAPPSGGTLVIVLFAGSGNTLYWMLRHQPSARGRGFELAPAVLTAGLDLRRTTPPIVEIVDVLAARFGDHRLLCAIQVHETVEPASLAELTPRFDWSALRVYHLNAPGENHGVLLGTRGWAP